MAGIKRNKLYIDLIWYLIGYPVPMIVAAFRSAIFTREFTTTEYGYYSIVTITFGFLSLMLFTSISSCIWRFYNRYKLNNRLNTLYTLLIIFYFISILILAVISSVWILISKDQMIIKLIKLCFFQFSTAELIMIFLIIIRLEGKAILYNVLNSLKLVISFLILLYFVFVLDHRIEAIITSNIIVNILLLAGLVLYSVKKLRFPVRSIYKKEIREFLTYGLVSVITKLGLLLLASSDRYIIKMFDDFDHVGIYNQVYNLGQISIVALVTVFVNAITPTLNRSLEENINGSRKLIRKYISLYIIYLLPVTVFLSLFARQLAIILLGKEFRVGDSIIPYVMISAFVFGLTMFNDVYLKFANKLRKVIFGVLMASVLNIFLNIVLIPLFDYKIAAVTTLISYVFLYLFYIYNDGFSYLNYQRNRVIVFRAGMVLIIQILTDQLIRKYLEYDLNIYYTLLEGAIFLMLYYFIMIGGKIKNTFLR